MLLRVNPNSRSATRIRGQRLRDFNLDERAFQEILFRNMDRLLPDEELLLIRQSSNWQEEPDLLAIDKQGTLYIFEIKVWEARSENLLQALRYGQILGTHDYEALNRLYKPYFRESRDLGEAHQRKFGCSLAKETFNTKQVFIIITNGIDVKTREACMYWRSQGLEVRPWVYRIYPDKESEFLLEMNRFAVEDNPYEDLATKFHVLNTNYNNDAEDHNDMLMNGKAAAYFDPWKLNIDRLSKGDKVFLYKSGVGIVAMGNASGNLKQAAYHGNPEHENEEHFMKLSDFRLVDPPVAATEIKRVTGEKHVFMRTMFSIGEDNAASLLTHIFETREF